jgi:uncharacterized protein (TIGR03435 family)
VRTLGIILLLAIAAEAQTPQFEVASIKRNTSSGPRGLGPARGHFVQSGTLKQLIQMAYRRGGYEVRTVSGGPKWIDVDRFDVDAAVDPTLSLQQLYLPDGRGSAGVAWMMLRSLLADRFKLVVHMETQQLPIFALVAAKRDGSLGPQLHRSDVDCEAVNVEMARLGRGVPPKATGQLSPCTNRSSANHLAANAMTMAQLAEMLSAQAGRDVEDKSGLLGNFDLTLDWTDDLSIFTALQEQLGLKLEPARGPVDVIVVDRAEPPTPD